MDRPARREPSGLIGSAAGWAFCAFAVIAFFFLIAEHRAHLGFLLPYVPFALLGVCFVLHSFMHGRAHGRYSGDETPGRDEARGRQADRSNHDHPHS
ncbi:MAG: DUF2933 domain-containing protein [Micropepsaceae bacterium]